MLVLRLRLVLVLVLLRVLLLMLVSVRSAPCVDHVAPLLSVALVLFVVWPLQHRRPEAIWVIHGGGSTGTGRQVGK